jgi:hypothetical protein
MLGWLGMWLVVRRSGSDTEALKTPVGLEH